MDEMESVLLAALPRLRPTLVSLGMPATLDDPAAVAWIERMLEAGWERELETSASGPR